MPTLERGDSDGDGTEEVEVGWNSLAGEAGAAVAQSGLRCPSGMVLDGELCKTPTVETVPVTRVCPQADDGYELVVGLGEQGVSHSCQKTVPAHCTGGKVLHDGHCQTETTTEKTEHEQATWICGEGTLVTSSGDHGVTHSCKIALDPPTCPTGEDYRITPSRGCYEAESYYKTASYGYRCPSGYSLSHDGLANTCTKTVSPYCTGGKSYRTSPAKGCYEAESYYKTASYRYRCPSGYSLSHDGLANTCTKTVPPYCTGGKSYRTSPSKGCYEAESYYKTASYRYSCPSSYSLTNAGEGPYCTKSVSPYCTGGKSYRTSPARGCYESESYYRTASYRYRCPSGYSLTNAGEGPYCTKSVSPYCTGGKSYRTSPSKGCYESESYYKTASYRYSCPSGYTLRTSGGTRSCTKTETYRKQVCSYDPIAGRQCWYENRTRTLTKSVIRSCPSGYSANGSKCRADRASTRWVKTSTRPVTTATANATRYCPSGYSASGSGCRADRASTRWVKTSTRPVTTATANATRYCPSGYSAAGASCEADTASTRYVKTATQPLTTLTQPATPYCDSGYSDNGTRCQADTASTRYVKTATQPLTTLTRPATPYCDSGFSDNGTRCEADTASTRWELTDSTPTQHRYGPADPSCTTADFAYSASNSRCEKTTTTTTYSDPTAPLTVLVGKPPPPSCETGWTLATGTCKRTVLGDPTALPTGAACIDNLGTLTAGTRTRTATLAAGCASLHQGDKQSPHWARRYRLRVAAASTATITASSAAADTYLTVQSGSGTTATVLAQDDDTGTGTDAETAGVELAAGTDYIVEVTTSVAGASGAFTLTIVTAYDEPQVVITGLADADRIGDGTVIASDTFTVEPAAAVCTAAAADATVSPRVVAGRGATRTVRLRHPAPYAHQVTVTCDAAGRSPTAQRVTLSGRLAISTVSITAGRACVAIGGGTAQYRCRVQSDGSLTVTATAQGAHSGISLAWTAAGGAKAGTPTHTAVTAVPGVGFARTSAAAVSCTADGTLTVTAAAAKVTKKITVDVDCANPPAACDDPLGSLAHGLTARSGTITADAACTTARRGQPGTFYARRHTFTLDAAATVTVDAAGSGALNAYAMVIRGHDAKTGTIAGRDDNSGPRSDARISSLRLPAGDHTIEITTSTAEATGSYGLRARVRYDTTVTIRGLRDAVQSGSGPLTVSEPFAVSPSTAGCTAEPPTATVTAGRRAQRTVTATLDRPASLQVTVTCTAPGHGPVQATATLTHAGALASITARTTTSGGHCTAVSPPPAGIDAAYKCTMGRANTVTAAADTTATGPTLRTTWTATGGVRLASPAQRGAVPLFAPDNTITGWQRTATAQLTCTTDGTATATAVLPDTDARKTAQLTITCADAVQIDGLADTTDNGTGTLTVTSGFTVTPTAAACTANPTTATVTAGVGGARTLSARVAVPGTLDVTVTCEAAGHTDGVRQVTLTAARPCSTHIGTLATGTVTRSGTITEGACVAKARLPRTTSVFYAAQRTHWAKRHTFTLTTPGWVTISIDNDPANTEPLDTYAVLLKDDDTKGTVIARDDNGGRRTDARLKDIFLRPGRYTIEATTKQPQTAGNYDLVVKAVVSGLADRYTATVGTPKTITFRYRPPDAQNAVKTAAAEEFGLTVTTRSAADGYGTATIALTPRLIHTHEDITVRVSSASAAGQLISFKLTARCPAAPPVPNGPTLTTSPHNNVLCIKTGTEYPAPKASSGPWGADYHYEVTPGTLNGVLESARAAIAARSDRLQCGLTVNKLAAFMLSVGHHEIRNTYETIVDGNYKHTFRPRTPARSAMALSRKDLGPTLVQAPDESDAEFKKRWGGFEGRMHLYSDNARLTGPARAFFHPGVGWWQIDDAGEWPYLNHGQRSDTGLGLNGEFDSTEQDSGGEAVAKKLANLYCAGSGGDAALRALFSGSTWYGCSSGGCFDSYEYLHLENSDDLYVTISEENSEEYSTSGGVKAHRCRWDNAGAGDPFLCFFHDPDRLGREGWMADWASSTRGVTTSPLAAGFVSFSYEGRRFAVFPGAILETFESGSISTRYKSIPERENAREKKSGEVVDGVWSSGSYNLGTAAAPQQARLEIEVCAESEWVKPEGGDCGDWHSVDGDGIADTMGVRAR